MLVITRSDGEGIRIGEDIYVFALIGEQQVRLAVSAPGHTVQQDADQTVRIGDSTVVRLLETRLDRVRLGIEAAPSIPISREELLV